jgi:predicted nucleic-acid-binding protein
MTGLDTNVLVRYLTQDDAKQAAQATALIENTLTVAKAAGCGRTVSFDKVAVRFAGMVAV